MKQRLQAFLRYLVDRFSPKGMTEGGVYVQVKLKLLHEYPASGQDLTTIRVLNSLNDDRACELLFSHKDHPWIRLIKRRIASTGAASVAHIDARIFLYILEDLDRPGVAVLWAYTLHRLLERRADYEALHFAEFLGYFNDGLPLASSYEQAWRDQKAGPVNLLDTPEQWT
jgi:hypothetical protein